MDFYGDNLKVNINNNKNKEYKLKTLAKVTLLGIVGKDPEVKPTKAGGVLATFPVATMVRKKDPNGQYFESTLWHNAVAFGKVAENIEKAVFKGSKIYIDGTIDYQEYIDTSGGQKLSTKILINDFSVVAKNEYQQAKIVDRETAGNAKPRDDFFSDDLPF